MALSESLEFILNANPSNVISAFDQVGAASDRALKATESNVGKIGSSLTKLGAGGVGVGGLLTQIASGDEQAAGQLKAAISSAGQVYDDFSSRIDKTVQQQVRFGHTDEEVKDSLATLVGSFGDTNKALDEMQLVTDLAARKHISLASAAEMVAKAHGGSARLFKEFGIQVQTNTSGTKDYDAALTQLAGKLQGQAAAGADTAAGKFRALKAEVENVASSFGEKFGPAILGASTIVTGVGAAMSGYATIQGRLQTAHAATAAAATEQAAAEAEAAAAEALVTSNSAAAVGTLYAESAAAETTAASLSSMALAAAPVAVLTAGITLLSSALQSNSEDAQRQKTDMDQVTKALQDTSQANDEALAKLYAQRNATSGFNDILNRAHLSYKGMADALIAGGSAWDKFKQQVLDSAKATGLSSDDLTIMRNGLDSTKSTLDSATRSVQANSSALTDASTSSSTFEGSLKAIDDQAKSTADAIDQAAQAGHQLLSADLQAKYAPLDIADAQARAADAKAKLGTGKTAAENAQLQRDYQRATLDVTRAVDGAAASQETLAETQAAANGQTVSAVDKNNFLIQALQQEEQYVTGPYKTAIDGQISQLQTLNDTYAEQLDLKNQIRQDQITQSDIPAEQLRGTNEVYTPIAPNPRIPGQPTYGRASGGALGPYSISGVNESGPEMFSYGGRDYLLTGSYGGYVHNAAQTAAMAGGSSQPMVHVGSMTVVAPEPEASGPAVVRALRRMAMVRPR